MVFLRKVSINETNYFYLFHTISKPSFMKYRRYVGTREPSKEKLEKISGKFLKDIKERPEIFSNELRENVVALLQSIQEKKNYLSEEDLVKLSKELSIPSTDLYGVVTFYSQFKLKKPGKYTISICRGTACHVKHSESLLSHLEDFLKIKSGEVTKDGKFSIESVNCIGACARAPAMMINDTVYGELTKDKIKTILGDFE